MFSASAIANPANTPKVEASFLDELTKTLRDGFTAAELTAAKKALRDERIGGRSSDGGMLNLIAAREQYGRTLAWDERAGREAPGADARSGQRRVPAPRHAVAALSIVKGGDFKKAKVYQ